MEIERVGLGRDIPDMETIVPFLVSFSRHYGVQYSRAIIQLTRVNEETAIERIPFAGMSLLKSLAS